MLAKREKPGAKSEYNLWMRASYRWELRLRALDLGPRTLIMGVVNVTPDSFWEGGRFFEPKAAIAHAL